MTCRTLLLVLALALHGLVPEAHAARRTYCYTFKTVPTATATYFQREQSRCDVIWTDSKIEISAPLKTNGGNVVLFAEEVTISAPIDTRPYFTTKHVFFDPPTAHFPNNQWHWSQKVVTETPKVYGDYFYWRESYDPQALAWKYGVSPGHFDNFDDDRLAAEYQAPQFPAARTPNFQIGGHFVAQGLNGRDAPVPAPEARRSGDVLIVANRIRFCDRCMEPYADRPLDPALADHGDTERRRFIVTSGVKGGLGSPGTQKRVVLPNLINDDVPNQSGRHGDGGDAGDIALVTYGPDGSDDVALWRRLIEANPGRPPFLGRLRTRSFASYRQYANRGSNVFTRLPADQPPPKNGLAGKIAFETRVQLEYALSLVQLKTATWNLTRTYNPEDLITELKRNIGRDEEVVLPSDAVGRQMLEFRRAIYLSFLKRTAIELASEPGAKPDYAHRSILDGVSCEPSALVLLAGGVRREVEALCRLAPATRPGRDKNEEHFLTRVGGVLGTGPNPDLLTRLDAAALLQRVQQLHDTLSQLKLEVMAIKGLLDEQVTRQQVKGLEQQVAALRQQIEHLKALESQDPGWASLGLSLDALAGAVLPPLGQAAAAFAKAQLGSTDASAAKQLVEQGNADLMSALQVLGKKVLPLAIELKKRSSQAGSGDAIWKAERQLSELLVDLADMQEQAASQREERLRTAGAAVVGILSARQAVAEDYQSSLDAFEPLLKRAIVLASAQPSAQRAYLNQRLNEISKFIANYGRSSIPVTFTNHSSECPAFEDVGLGQEAGMVGVGSCTELRNRTERTLTVYGTHPVFGRLPMAVLDAGMSIRLSLGGLNLVRTQDNKIAIEATPL